MSALLEPWLDKRDLARHLRCSVRSIERFAQQGMPYSTIVGRAKFQVSAVLPWLEEHGHAEHHAHGGRLTAPNHQEAA